MSLLKAVKQDKTYEAIVECENPISNEQLAEIEQNIQGKEISQRTPMRVSYRRADLVRKRKVEKLSCEKLSDNTFKAVIRGESGLYIKELISGDGGRTKPAFSDFVGACKCV